MSVETFITFYKDWVRTLPDDIESNVIWHGGEPTLRGVEFFEDVLAQSQILTPPGKKIRHCIQTNGVSIDQRWTELFTKFQVLVGISLDGPADINDIVRISRGGKGTFEKVRGTYELLVKSGVNVGIVVVVHKHNVKRPDDIFRFLKENGIKRLQLSPCLEYDDKDNDYSIENGDFADFVCRLYDLWLMEDDPEITIGIVNDVVDHFLGKHCRNCMFGDNCHNFVVLNYDGVIKSCDGLRSHQTKIGQVTPQEDATTVFFEGWDEEYKTISKARKQTCGDCQWFEICHGGCPYHWPNNGPTKTGFCEAHKRIFSHIASSIKSVYGEL